MDSAKIRGLDARYLASVLKVRFFRKKGQSGVNPQLPTQLTEGQFESSTRLEIYQDR